MSKHDNKIFKNGYDYYQQYRNDLDTTLKCLNSCVILGNELINSYQFYKIDIKLNHIDTELTLISRLVWFELTIFAFKWNEFFANTLKIKYNEPDNWFWYVSNFNNLSKHIDIEVNQFFHGFFKPSDYISKDEINNLIQQVIDSRDNPKMLLSSIKTFIQTINEIKYKLNKEKGFDYLNKTLKISSYQDFLDKTEIFLPQYENYLSQYLNKGVKTKEELQKNIDELNDFFSNKELIKKFKKLIIDKAWYFFCLRINNVVAFLLFIDEMMKKVNFKTLVSAQQSFLFINFSKLWQKFIKNKKKIFKKLKFKNPKFKKFFQDIKD